MKENILKVALYTLMVSLTAYLRILIVPVIMLIIVMTLDYVTGMAAAWSEGALESKKGAKGAVKKFGYLVMVVVGGVVDWLLYQGLTYIGISFDLNYYFAIMITIWLIINELISILENAERLGLPKIPFLNKIISKLKISIENKGGDKNE